MNNTYLKKYGPLVIAVIIIVGAIVFLQSKKSPVSTVGTGDESVIPVSTSTIAGFLASTTSTTTTVGTLSKADIESIIAQKSAEYPRVRELVDPQGFVNSDPFHIADYVGKKVILIDFWAYSCINCQRTLPYVEGWYTKYENDGFVVIGVHAPEFEFEKNYDNVKRAASEYGLTYPIVLDNDLGTWNAYQNRFWPAHYLIDIDGFIVDKQIGEGGYAETEKKIQDLLKERSDRLGLNENIPTGTVNAAYSVDANSPETYFGYERNEFFGNGAVGQQGTQTLKLPTDIDLNKFYLDGTWNFDGEFATNQTAGKIVYKYNAKNVFMVSKSDKPITITVKKDGVEVKQVTIQNADLYTLIQDASAGTHTMEIDIDSPGLEVYTFTFG